MTRKKIVVLSGAGVSAESGVSTFRDNGGLWDKYDVQEVASHEGWLRNPGLVLRFYNERRAQMKDAKPNQAHLDIASLESRFDVAVVTQNVDDLHEKAGSTRVIHLHGELNKVRPEDSYSDSDLFDESRIVNVGYGEVNLGDKDPRGVQYRPHIVFFGEAVPEIAKASKLVMEADILLIVGTSLQVYPAAGLWRYAGNHVPVYVIDPKDVPISGSRITHIQATATAGMKKFIELIDTGH
ncbi:MAG: NAD-dependent deacylase [Bacteroidales bacterium]|nr:NAD-dependent deacylase [Bacteroidales bacterium]